MLNVYGMSKKQISSHDLIMFNHILNPRNLKN
jgi:hypothetical protein